MSKTKWGVFYSVIIFVDILQFILTLFAVGVVVNPIIDAFVGFFLPFSLHLCGIKMTDYRKVLSILAAFGFELIPVVDALPLWTLDLILIHSISKGEEKLKEHAPMVAAGIKKVSGAGQKMYAPLNKDGMRLPNKS